MALVTLSRNVSKMSRAALLGCTLALLFSVGAGHAQQGNLPTPVQKLPAYPPVACVTPDWRPEPCEDRNASGWRCGNVKVTVSHKDSESTDFLVTGVEKSNNRFTLKAAKDELSLNGKLCTLFDNRTKTKWPEPPEPESQEPPATQLPEPVKCLKPDGREEPCESRHTGAAQAQCQGVNVAGANVARGPCHTEWLARQSKQLSDRITRQERRFEVWTLPAANFGGDLHEHVTYFRELAKQVDRVEIFDPCFSACTLVTVYIEKERLCFGEQASLNFHQAQKSWTDQSAVIEATKWMIAQYPMDIREWILRKGGHDSMPAGFKYWTLPASELWEMGYRKCSY